MLDLVSKINAHRPALKCSGAISRTIALTIQPDSFSLVELDLKFPVANFFMPTYWGGY